MVNYFKRKGKRLEANKVIVRETKNGQFSLTVPKSMAKSAKLYKGCVVEFEYEGAGVLIIRGETSE